MQHGKPPSISQYNLIMSGVCDVYFSGVDFDTMIMSVLLAEDAGQLAAGMAAMVKLNDIVKSHYST